MAGKSWISTEGELWRITLPDGYSHEEFCFEFDGLTERLHRAPPGLRILLDATHVQRSDVHNRERAARFFRDERELIQGKIVAWAFVTPSALLRGAITAIGWMGKFPIDVRSFDSDAGAIQWLSQK